MVVFNQYLEFLVLLGDSFQLFPEVVQLSMHLLELMLFVYDLVTLLNQLLFLSIDPFDEFLQLPHPTAHLLYGPVLPRLHGREQRHLFLPPGPLHPFFLGDLQSTLDILLQYSIFLPLQLEFLFEVVCTRFYMDVFLGYSCGYLPIRARGGFGAGRGLGWWRGGRGSRRTNGS